MNLKMFENIEKKKKKKKYNFTIIVPVSLVQIWISETGTIIVKLIFFPDVFIYVDIQVVCSIYLLKI